MVQSPLFCSRSLISSQAASISMSNTHRIQMRPCLTPIWFNHWPSFLTSKVQPTCEALDVQINSKFSTNQTGLTYTLTNIWQSTKEDSVDVLSSMTYYNNPIEDCVINPHLNRPGSDGPYQLATRVGGMGSGLERILNLWHHQRNWVRQAESHRQL